jgi:hypothetical protein
MARRFGTAFVGYIMHSGAEWAVGGTEDISDSPSCRVGCAGGLVSCTHPDDGEDINVLGASCLAFFFLGSIMLAVPPGV